MMTSRKIAAFALLALLGAGFWAASASARSCTTTCYGNSCTTNCW
jgi:isoaspartyl peptidase/L-asparaginase-like protein (Ntn-hydrolase superfamily)